MIITGGPPDPERTPEAAGASGAVICSACGALWQLSVVMSTFSEEEKERFWAGKGCPDCRFQWSSY